MGIPPGVPVKAAKSIGPCPDCRADCPGTQRPAHPPGGMPGLAGGVAPGGRTATHTESTLYQDRAVSAGRHHRRLALSNGLAHDQNPAAAVGTRIASSARVRAEKRAVDRRILVDDD